MSNTPTPPPPPAIRAGEVVLERYRVVEQIASGGHSVVYRGTDERLSRPVCIKVFSGFGGESGVGRTSYEHFVQEAFALSRLTHPNTLRIYDFGHLGTKIEPGMPLQVCEFMNGGTLSQVIREDGKQSLAETTRIAVAMCAALGEAHGLGIVHRDIKPQNILFTTVGHIRLPKLADFGIAKWSSDTDATNPSSSKRAEDTAIVAGQKLAMYSPSWAAPEQLAGQPVSAATDIYSLACVMVYMLSGRAIFADEDVYAGYKKRRDADDLIRDALTPAGVPDRLIALMTRALAFDPKRRPAAVEELSGPLADEVESPLWQTTPTSRLSAVTPSAPVITVETEDVVMEVAQPAEVASAVETAPVAAPAPTPAPKIEPSWVPPALVSPWMAQVVPQHSSQAHRLLLSDAPIHAVLRRVHFVMAANGIVDLTGTQGSRIRVTLLPSPSGGRVAHVKGLTCFVSVLGGRPSPAVHLEHGADLALVTPRAQEIGHVRVATGTSQTGTTVFPLGSEWVAVGLDDCLDPILFDFGPGSDAYLVYTRGRALPKRR
jgi:serine/threonine-protein kinase